MGLEVASEIDQPNLSNCRTERPSLIRKNRQRGRLSIAISGTIETPIPVATIAKIVENNAQRISTANLSSLQTAILSSLQKKGVNILDGVVRYTRWQNSRNSWTFP